MNFTAAAATALALAITASSATAGVVITETVARKNAAGERKVERVVMVQGNKQKVINGDQVFITDLDAGKLSILRTSTKQVAEGPFPPVGMFAAVLAREGVSVGFKKATTAPHKRDKFVCQDYNGSATVKHANIGMIECVSKDAPGAKEYTEYRRLMAQKLKGSPLEIASGEVPDGIPISVITNVTQQAFAATGGVSPEILAKLQADYDKHPTVTFTNVSKIEVKDIAAAEFAVPADFKKQDMPNMTIKTKPDAAASPAPAAH